MIDREELIEKFLDQCLTDAELAIFKEKWGSDKNFVKAVRARATLKLALAASERMDNPTQANRQGAIWFGKSASKVWAIGIAASMALLVATGIALWVQTTASAQSLAQAHMIHIRLQTTREVVKPARRWDTALQAYAHGDTPLAINLLKDAIKGTSDKEEYLHDLGDIYLASNLPDSAIHYYQMAMATLPGDPYTKWNTAIAWLHKGEVTKAKKYLATMEGPYAENAKSLLKTMDEVSFKFKNWLYGAPNDP